MYVYIPFKKVQSESLFVVGFYDPQGQWQPESDHSSREEAALRVHYLNGGSRPQDVLAVHITGGVIEVRRLARSLNVDKYWEEEADL